MLRNSSVFLESETKFGEGEFLIVDSAYPIQPWLMTPHKNYGNMTHNKKGFNKRMSSARVAIERAFGQLKGHFHRLRKFDSLHFKLHNFCLKSNDEAIEEIEMEEDNAAIPRPYDHAQGGVEKRRELEMFLAR